MGGILNQDDGSTSHGRGEVHTRFVRLDFPMFQGDDPTGRLFKVHHFFTFHNTLPQHCIRLASFHMEGQAVVWFQDMEELGQLTYWDAFVKAMLVIFGPNGDDNPIKALTSLRQTG